MKGLKWMIEKTVCYLQQESHKAVIRLVSESLEGFTSAAMFFVFQFGTGGLGLH